MIAQDTGVSMPEKPKRVYSEAELEKAAKDVSIEVGQMRQMLMDETSDEVIASLEDYAFEYSQQEIDIIKIDRHCSLARYLAIIRTKDVFTQVLNSCYRLQQECKPEETYWIGVPDKANIPGILSKLYPNRK